MHTKTYIRTSCHASRILGIGQWQRKVIKTALSHLYHFPLLNGTRLLANRASMSEQQPRTPTPWRSCDWSFVEVVYIGRTSSYEVETTGGQRTRSTCHKYTNKIWIYDDRDLYAIIGPWSNGALWMRLYCRRNSLDFMRVLASPAILWNRPLLPQLTPHCPLASRSFGFGAQ